MEARARSLARARKDLEAMDPEFRAELEEAFRSSGGHCLSCHQGDTVFQVIRGSLSVMSSFRVFDREGDGQIETQVQEALQL